MKRFNLSFAARLLFFFFTILSFSNIHTSAFGEEDNWKANLDLPFDAGGDSEDETTAPEIVVFYGQIIETDSLFYVMDRSSSTKNGEIEIEKRQLVKSISEFSDKMEFGIVFFSSKAGPIFPESKIPVRATATQKGAAIGFVSGIQAGGVTCPKEALNIAIQMANKATKTPSTIVYLGDGETTCTGGGDLARKYADETLAAVAAWNYKKHKINAILAAVSGTDEYFPRELANQNHGTFTKITR